jgi:hypothetical protein
MKLSLSADEDSDLRRLLAIVERQSVVIDAQERRLLALEEQHARYAKTFESLGSRLDELAFRAGDSLRNPGGQAEDGIREKTSLEL